MAAQVATVLSYAHEVPVINRDLRPGYILVACGGTVKILDFGIGDPAHRCHQVNRRPARPSARTSTWHPSRCAAGGPRRRPICTRSDTFVLLRVMPHDKAVDWAIKQKASINTGPGPFEIRDILDKPFAAWRVFLHPSQHKVAYGAGYSGPAQVTGGPGTGKTVVALHRVRHLLGFLRDGERILLTTWTNALVEALRSGLAALVEDRHLRDRVDITTVDALASRVVATSRRPLRGGEGQTRWEQAAWATGFTGTAQFLAQEYKHVVLAQNVRSVEEYEAADRPRRGSRLPVAQRLVVWRTFQAFSDGLAADGLRTYLGTCAEAADLLEGRQPLYRHIVVGEAQDLHPAQWRLLGAAAPPRPDDLFIAGDPHQRIYDSKVSLKALGIKVTGRSTKMRKNYRSTHEIPSWSTALLVGRPFAQLEDDDRNETLLGYRSALHGNGPVVHGAASADAELDALVAQIRTWTEAGVSPRDIGVSARFNKNCAKAIERLTAAGIPAAPRRSGPPRTRPPYASEPCTPSRGWSSAAWQ